MKINPLVSFSNQALVVFLPIPGSLKWLWNLYGEALTLVSPKGASIKTIPVQLLEFPAIGINSA